MGEVIKAEFTKCSGKSCKNRVKVHPTNKKILCRKCWIQRAEEEAVKEPSMMHVAFSEEPHEFFVYDYLQEFINTYDIERPHS